MDFDLRISHTGIRDGEIITSSSTGGQNKGVVMQVFGFFPPDVAQIKNLSVTDIRDKFNLIPFFESMTYEERSLWLQEHGDIRKDLYMDDVDLRVKFIRIDGPTFFTKTLGQEIISQLLRGNPNSIDNSYSIQEIFNMFPRKPGSRATRHTLVFRPGNWKLFLKPPSPDTYTGIYFDFETFTLNSGTINKPNNGYLEDMELGGELSNIGIYIVSKRSNKLSLDDMFELCRDWVHPDDLRTFSEVLKWFPPSLHKSLIQKLIRTRCSEVEHSQQKYLAVIPLLVSFSMLMTHPGVFVPNIQRFVSGTESATKRLAVSICEDSYTNDFDGLTSLYVAALMKQRIKDWEPTDEMLKRWIRIAVQSQVDYRNFDYDIHTFVDDIKVNRSARINILGISGINTESVTIINPLDISYLILKEIKSFHSDIKMVGSIAQRSGQIGINNNNNKQMVMPLVHCVDHHSFGDIAHFMPYKDESYGEVFKEIWQKAVGVNSRSPHYANYYLKMEEDSFVRSVRQAQVNLWISKMYTPQPRNILETTQTFSYDLDSSWIAGLIGPIEVRLKGCLAMVVLQVDNIYEMTAVRKPSRDTNAPQNLTDEEQIMAITLAKNELEKGIKLCEVPIWLSKSLHSSSYHNKVPHVIVKLVGDDYLITIVENPNSAVSSCDTITWEDARRLRYELPLHPTISIDSSQNLAVLHTGEGLDEKSATLFSILVKRTDLKVLRRLMVYLDSNRSKIEMYKVSRDGSGTYYTVLPEDTGVHIFLCGIALIYPGAIEVIRTGFNVKIGPLIWNIRDNLSRYLSSNTHFTEKWVEPLLEKRQRWEHQKSSVEQMIERNKLGKKGHLIWIDLGLGKTLIILDYLTYLIQENKMPQYCVYSLPPSAIDNTIIELETKGFPYKIIDARKSAKKGENIIEPLKVNIIRHDHMILNDMNIQLKSIIGDCFIIIDEFHKTLAKTKRTSIALELTRLSSDFAGMSGTIIKNNDSVEELIEWVQQIVDFEVTTKNFWVAIGALVSRKVQTPVVVERELIEVDMSDEIKEQYYSLVPDKMGGTASSIKFKEALELSYQVVTEKMIELTMEYIRLHEGVFVVAKNIAHQTKIKDELIKRGIQNQEIFLFGKDSQITLTPDYQGPVKIVITSLNHSSGYTLTKFRVMIQSEYPSNQATREQLEGRINRIGQTSSTIRIVTVVTGILTYFHQNHEKIRSLSTAVKQLSRDVGIDYKSINY